MESIEMEKVPDTVSAELTSEADPQIQSTTSGEHSKESPIEDSAISSSSIAETNTVVESPQKDDTVVDSELRISEVSSGVELNKDTSSTANTTTLDTVTEESEVDATSKELVETESETTTAQEESRPKLSDLRIEKPDHSFSKHLEPKASESPPLLLLQGTTGVIEDDSVFSGSDLHQIPDQLLAEPSTDDPEELEARTEKEIVSNIEEQLREFEGSDDESLLQKETVAGEDNQDSIGDDLPTSKLTNKDDTDDDAKHIEKKNEERTKTLSQEDRTESPKSTEAMEEQASESRSRKNEKSVSTPDSNEEPTPLSVSSADQTTLADIAATNDDLSNDSLNTSDKTIPFVEVDVNMSAKETSIDVEEKDVFADIHNENSQSIPGESRSEKDEQDQSKSPMEKDDPKGEKDTDEAEKMDVDTEDSVQPVEIENHPVDPIGQSEEDTSAQKTSSDNYSVDKDMEPKDSTKTTAQDTEEIVLCVVQTKTRTEQSGEKDSKLISNSNQKSNVLKCSESLDSSVVEHMDVDSSKSSDDNDKTKGDGKEKCSQSKETNTKVEERISKRIKPPADTEKSKPSTDKGKKNNSKEKETSLDTMEVDEVEELSKELSKDKNVEVTKLPQKVEKDDEVKQKNAEQSSVDVEILDVEEMLTNDQQETSNKEGNLDEVDKLKGADEEICLLPDSEQDLTEADKERAILAKEQSHKEEISKAESSSVNDDCTNLDEEGSDITSADGNTPEEDTSEIRPNEITELSNAVKDVKCYKCKKLKSCKYKALIDGEHKYFCDYKCVQFFRHANKDLYKLNSKKIIITSTVEMKNFCSRCKTQKNCRYQFCDPEISTTTSYLCDTRCLDHITGQNVDKYVLRSKRYIVEEMLKDEQKKCYHCGENKACKYFFLHDDERFYICHDDCFNLLAKEQPDKFRIKRRVVRVRDLRATSTNVTSTETEKDKIVARTEQEAEVARRERESSFIRRCAHCFQQIQFNDNTLCWETLDFCNEVCLKAYQFLIGSSCTMCKQRVSLQSLGKYCVRFGFEVRQFCRSTCLDNFKKGLKVCSYCQKDISKTKDGFLAPVGDKNQFKDFCSQTCMVKYEGICTPKKKFPIVCCSVCNAEKQSSVEVTLDDRTYNFCSNPCFSAFKFVNNIVPDQCLVCLKYFERKSADNFTLYQDQVAQVFCCKICLNIFIILNRKIVPCEWCKVKKYNFDMIQQKSGNIMLMLCSISCLTYYRSSMNAVSVKKQICDHCLSEATSQYHLTMSDATVRNFCTYHCVMEFQSQFGHKPLTLDQPETNKITTATQPVPTGLPKRIKSKANAIPMQQTTTTTKTSTTKVTILPVQQKQVTKSAVPVISNVTSLAPQTTMASSTAASSTTRALRGGRGRQTQQTQSTTIQTETEKLSSQNVLSVKKATPITTRRSAATSNSVVTQVVQESTKPVEASTTFTNSSTQTTRPQKKNVGVNVGDSSVSSTGALPVTQKQGTASEPKIEYKTNVVTLPPKPPLVANKQTMCKPSYVSKGVSCRPHSVSTACQTDASIGNKVLIPIPVPIYVPQPMCMYSLPFPCPVPIPLPIPIPIFIPTTRNSAEGIMKEIKKIQEKMPSDPFEAELLMMAALVADDKKKNDSDSETEEEHHEQAIIEPEYPTETIEPSNSFGEDMLQMALKMATEYDEPAVDLESAMTSNTISHAGSGDEIVDDHEIHQAHMMIMEPQRQVDLAMRAKKRPASPGIKLNRPGVATPNKKVRKVEVRPSSQVVEKPDANMCLKYTFGVNAWKQWIMTKNADLEKTSIRRKPFKTELLQLTADELNYSLSLFVKEVRKPNGSEYAPDTIYYLVLGIQQYLYENNRIDNIFTDPYYERFTDCLDEVARKFSVLYNDAQYIVTRVEEEHLWECKQLGAHSPHVLLSTLMFFNTKHFNLTTVEEHMQLSFSHIMKHWKRSPPGTKLPGSRNVLLRFYPPQTGEPNPRKKKVYEQQENDENPLRCPVKLYEFYLSKCPESVKTRNDVFYLQPERSCVPDSPVWYSTQPLSKEALNKMLHRVKMVKEINIALLSS